MSETLDEFASYAQTSSQNNPTNPFIFGEGSVPPKPSIGWLLNPAHMAAYWGPRLLGQGYDVDRVMRESSAPINPSQPRPRVPSGNRSDFNDSPASATPPPYDEPSTIMAASHEINDVPDSIYSIHVVLFHATKINPNTGKPEKKKSTSKVANHSIFDTDRADMVNALLFAHDLHKEFQAGERVGPKLKIWWTGVSKSLASTVNTDADWKEVRSSLQRKTEKARNMPNVYVEIQCDDLKGFRVSPSTAEITGLGPLPSEFGDDPFAEVVTEQSTVFTAKARLHGDIILELKKLWPCSCHLGENGGQGYCYISGNPDREHVKLTNYRLRVWAAACANLEATKHEPPATLAFDGPDNGLPAIQPRGKKGPGPSTLTPTPSTSSSADTLVGLVLGKLLSDRQSSPRYHPYQTPARRPVPVSPPRQLMSPAAPEGMELENCLASFLHHEGIDFTSHASTLLALDLTPDILSSADTPALD
ncbi:hypothetical protein BKA70DRAFT_1425424 [Coprinopsis sp. MPI-PUGE-AT-0042]|nr:hypothetical protein BKA70DRAFT_1425424 [Coprinopsis sp. MPI-PUGE-AT-0042]